MFDGMHEHRADLDILGEAAEYPGHPVTLAYLIVRLYPSLDAARARGMNYAVVEEDGRLPGAGGQNSSAVDMLRHLGEGVLDWERAVKWGDDAWAATDGQKSRPDRIERWRKGQAQADKIKPLLREALKTWPGMSRLTDADSEFPYVPGLPSVGEIQLHEERTSKVQGQRLGWWQRIYEDDKPEMVVFRVGYDGAIEMSHDGTPCVGAWFAPTVGGWESEPNRFTRDHLRRQDDSLWAYRPCTAKGTPVPRPMTLPVKVVKDLSEP